MRPDDELVTIDTSDPVRPRAVSLSLGLVGVLTRVTLATVPAYKLRERTRVLPFDECLDGFLPEEAARRNAEFWWLPAHELCVLKTFAETGEESFRVEAPEALLGTIERYLRPDAVDWSWRIYPSTRSFPFVEIEYTLPLAEGPAAMREVRHPDCTLAVEYRTRPGEQSLRNLTRDTKSAAIVPGRSRRDGSGGRIHERVSGEAGTDGRYVRASALITASGSLSITRSSVRAARSG